MRQERIIRILLVTAAVTLAVNNIIRSSSISFVDSELILPVVERRNQKVAVYCHNTKLKESFLCQPSLNVSERLLLTFDPHAEEVIWTTSDLKGVLPLVNESIQIRLERHGYALTVNHSQSVLDGIDPHWKIFFVEYSDLGVGDWGFWFIKKNLVPLIGWKRIHYITRFTQNRRFMDHSVKASPSSEFGPLIGTPLNFTEKLGTTCASVQRLHFSTRDDVADGIDEYVMSNQKKFVTLAAEAHSNGMNTGLGFDIANFSRPTHVRTFWNKDTCNKHCLFRSHVSDAVASIPQKHPSINVNTDVVGFRRKRGRTNVHQNYIAAMLSTKIIVLAQRDRWEDHMRLDEALLSGALVMTDPYVYYPHGIITEGEQQNIVVYDSITDMEHKIVHYLNPDNEDERVQIGRRGREVSLTQHRVWQNAERLLLNDMKYSNEYGLFNKPWMQ